LSQAVFSFSTDDHALLGGLRLFDGVERVAIDLLLERSERADLHKGQVLLSPGTANEHVYVVLAGALRVHVGSLDAAPAAVLGSGDCVGEMSIIESRDPSAWVVAAEPTHVLVLHQTLLWELIDASHAFAKNLLVVLSERVRSHNQLIADSYGELQKIQRHATTDALTGLGNRHSMQAMFPRKIRRCLRAGDPVSLIMIDVDNLKVFNDQFGHLAGDRALKTVAKILAKTFRPCDTIVRYGGDEFAVLLPKVDRNDASVIAERVRSAVSGDDSTNDDSLVKAPIRISMGVADTREASDLDALLRAADAALYRAKRSGRNAVAD